MGRLLTWLLTTPILVVGLFAGHEVGYRLAVPDPQARAHALGETGHGYFAYAPYLVAVVTSLAVVALGLRARQAFFGRRGGAAPSAVALLPPLAFVILEATERLRLDELTVGAMASPEVLIGLVLQVPFAVAALVVARLLASVADALGAALRPAAVPRVWGRLSILLPAEADLPQIRVVALAYGERGPPSSSG